MVSAASQVDLGQAGCDGCFLAQRRNSRLGCSAIFEGPHPSCLCCRNRQRAVATFQAALQDIQDSTVPGQLGLAALEEPPTLGAPDLARAAASAAALLASAHKAASVVGDPSLQGIPGTLRGKAQRSQTVSESSTLCPL